MSEFKSEMSVKERKKAYFKGNIVDRLPCAIMLEETAAVYAGLSVKEYYFDADKMLKAEKFKVRKLGAESAGINVTLRGMAEALGSKIGYSDTQASYLIEPILKDYKMLDNMKIVDPYKDGRLPIILEALGKIKKELGDEVSISSGVSGPLSAASTIRGTENMMKDMVKNKKGLHKLLNFVTECNLAFVKAVYLEHGLICNIGDPVSCGNLISKKQFEKLSEPYLRKTIDGIYKITGQKPSLHICGKTKEIWPNLRDMNISAFSVDNCEDIEELKKILGDKMCLVGNIDPVSIIKNGTIRDVHDAVKLCIEKAGDSPNGYIIGSGCDIPGGAPVENIKAIIEATKEYSKGIKLGKKFN